MMYAKCCYINATRKAALRLLAVLSAMVFAITVYLAAIVASHGGSDVPNFDAPRSDDGSSRRDLSGGRGNGTADGDVVVVVVDVANDHRTESPLDVGNATESPPMTAGADEVRGGKDERRPSSSGTVVYEYIPPPSINVTARARLRRHFPLLADLNQSSSTSTALCGIVKDAEPYLDEWVDYYFGLGVHTIYLIDNSDQHELRNWQDRRRNSGYSVRVLPKPGTHRQMYSYHMCASEFRNDHAYMAFFDVDEYLVLFRHDTVSDFLRDHLPGRGALQISWYIFGTNSRDMYSPLPVTKRFTLRDGTSENDRHPTEWHNVKTILRLSDYGNYPKVRNRGANAGN
jgi:hypothetical protein